MNTMVVNCYAGPGAGKTTCAWEVASQLKKKGINTEYVSEYAKELVWEGKYDFIDNIESSISNGQAVEPQDYDFYKTLVSEPEQINSEVDMNEDFEM